MWLQRSDKIIAAIQPGVGDNPKIRVRAKRARVGVFRERPEQREAQADGADNKRMEGIRTTKGKGVSQALEEERLDRAAIKIEHSDKTTHRSLRRSDKLVQSSRKTQIAAS